MKVRIFLFVFLLTLFIFDNAYAGRSSSRGSSSRGSSSRGSSSRGSSSYGSSHHSSYSSPSHHSSHSSPSHSSSSHSSPSHSSSSHGSSPHSSPSHSSSYGSSSHSSPTHSSSSYGSSSHLSPSNSKPSGNSMSGSTSAGHDITQSKPSGYGSSSGHIGSNPTGHGSSPSQTSHQQNKDASSTFLQAEGGGATRLATPGSQVGKPGFTTENKQTSPYNPSAPSQNHASPSFGQPSAPFNPSHGGIPQNPSWSNPHYNPSQSQPPIGFKDHMRPTSMPVPSAPYPLSTHINQHPPPYPTSHSIDRPPPYSAINSNQHPPPYPGYPSSYHPHSIGSQPHSTYNPHIPYHSQTIGHPSSYPTHIPPPVPHTFGNPYSTHPVGSPYTSVGQSYYPPQQYMLAQPAAQPYIPGHTVIMAPAQQDSGRGFGQMVKEALVFSTVNAGVNRLLNPHHHHHYTSDYSRPASSDTSSTITETHITYNNHYINGVPSSNTPVVPPSPGTNLPQNVPGSNPGNYPVNNPAVTPPVTPGVSTPTIVGNNATVNPSVHSSTGTGDASTTGSSSQNNTANNQGSSNQWGNFMPQYKISDNELLMITEELFVKQDIDIFNMSLVMMFLQNTAKSPNVTDEAKGSFLHVDSSVYEYPSIFAIRALYDNYEHNSSIKENHTLEKRKEEDVLLDVLLSTNVMARTMRWLSERGFIDPDDFERKDVLKHIWFSQFDGATSGFERIFTSERYGNDLLGVQDWIYFEYQESRKRIDYMGYVDTLKLGNNAWLVKLNFKMDDVIRPNATIFVGTLPELEMALYTICFYARPNDLCPVSLGGSKFNIYTHSFRYYGKDIIDLALPIF